MGDENLNSPGDIPLSSRNGDSASLVEQFVTAWRSASAFEGRPRIADYLVTIPDPQRSEVFYSLLAVELKYREAAGEVPDVQEYVEQYPDVADLVKSAFKQSKSGNQSGQPLAADSFGSEQTGEYRPSSIQKQIVSDIQAEFATPSTMRRGRPITIRVSPILKLPEVPGFEVLDVLGRGGMGIVYRARHLQLGRLVALKMILPGRELSPGIMARFLNEARVVARFQHPHIVQIYEVGEFDGFPYLTLELLDGGSLYRKLEGTTLPALKAADILESLAQAVEYAHQKDVVHRDLKPSNVLFTSDGTLKITDFGLAKYIDENEGQTEDGGILGTPSYMAPEQASGTTDVGRPADVYALGAILYEMLTGRPPFKAPDKWQTINQVKTQEPIPPRNLASHVPRDLELICLKCLDKDPRQRFASARDLAEELNRFRQGRPILTRPTPVWERAWKWTKRQPAVASLMAVSVIALFSLILYLEQRASAARRELGEQQRVTDLRGKVQTLQFQVRDASERGQIQDAQGFLQAASELVRVEPALKDQSSELALLQSAVAQQEIQHQGKIKADGDYQRFFRFRDDALFHGMVFTGVELPANLEATKNACRDALNVFSSLAQDGPIYSEHLSADRRQQCNDTTYELLLVWAEAEAQSHSGDENSARVQHEKAVQLLLVAARLRGEQPPTVAYHLRSAKYLEHLGKRDEAQRERQQAAAAQPQGALDYFLTGDAHQKSGRLAEAAREYANALQEQPDHFWAQYFLAICNLQLLRPAQARDNLTACMISRRDFVWLYLLRGFANSQLNDFRAAEKDYQDALSLRPNRQASYGLLINRGVLHLRQARSVDSLNLLFNPLSATQSALFALQGVAEAHRQKHLALAFQFLEDAERLEPEQCAAYRYKAIVLQQQRKLDPAAEQIGLAIEKAKALEPAIRSQLHSQRARLHKEQRNLDAALADLRYAVAIRPSAEDQAEQGRILHAQSKFQQAISAYQSALALQPENAEIYRLKADAHLALRQDLETVDALDQFFAKNGRPTAEIYRLRGLVHARLRQFSAAVADYSQSVALQSDPATLAARGWIYLAYDVFPLALQDFDDAIRLDPKFAEAYAGRGLIRVRQGLMGPALADAEASLRHGQLQSPRLLWNIAHIYAQLAVEPATKGGVPPVIRTRYQEVALKLLRQAFEKLPATERANFWEQYIAADALLMPLRGNAGYELLEREFRKPAKSRVSTDPRSD